MNKGLVAILMLILLLPGAFASHNQDPIIVSDFSKHIYNLGDMLVTSYNVVQDSDTSAIFKLKLECGSYSLEYFTQPIDLAAHEQKRVAASGLTLQKAMAGTCVISSTLFSTSNEVLATKDSNSFVVTPDIAMDATTDKKDYLPEDALTILLNISPSYGDFKGSAVFELDKEIQTANISGNSFSHAIKIENDSKSGTHELLITIKDSYGNKGERIVAFEVLAVPTKIMLTNNKETFTPLEELRSYVTVTDQAGDQIEKNSATVTITNSEGTVVHNESYEIGKVFTYKLAQNALPGNYTIHVSSMGLEMDSIITVEEVEQIETTFDNRIVKITNTGNIEYQKPVNVSLIKEGKSYSIVRKLSLEPLASYEIDLFKELPEGSYNVTVPSKEGVAVYPDVQIQDERSIGKKLGDVFSPITGNSVRGDSGSALKKTFFFLVAFIVVAFITIIGIRTYTNREKNDTKKEIQLKKELEQANQTPSTPKGTIEKSTAKPASPAFKPLQQKQPILRDDPEIKRFVDRVLREK